MSHLESHDNKKSSSNTAPGNSVASTPRSNLSNSYKYVMQPFHFRVVPNFHFEILLRKNSSAMAAELEYEKGVLEKRKERCFQMCSTAVICL